MPKGSGGKAKPTLTLPLRPPAIAEHNPTARIGDTPKDGGKASNRDGKASNRGGKGAKAKFEPMLGAIQEQSVPPSAVKSRKAKGSLEGKGSSIAPNERTKGQAAKDAAKDAPSRDVPVAVAKPPTRSDGRAAVEYYTEELLSRQPLEPRTREALLISASHHDCVHVHSPMWTHS